MERLKHFIIPKRVRSLEREDDSSFDRYFILQEHAGIGNRWEDPYFPNFDSLGRRSEKWIREEYVLNQGFRNFKGNVIFLIVFLVTAILLSVSIGLILDDYFNSFRFGRRPPEAVLIPFFLGPVIVIGSFFLAKRAKEIMYDGASRKYWEEMNELMNKETGKIYEDNFLERSEYRVGPNTRPLSLRL